MSYSKVSAILAAIILTVSGLVYGAGEEAHTWKLSGNLYVDSDSSVIFAAVTNTVEIPSATLWLYYDTTKVKIVNETDVKLLNRASDLSPATTLYSTRDYAYLTIFSTTGGVIEPGTGDVISFKFRVRNAAVGDTVHFSLTDKDADFLLASLALVVQGVPNEVPVFVDPGPQSGTMGVPLQLFLSASDADKDKLTYRMLTSPGTGATLDSITGLFSWTPAAGGQSSGRFTVSDGHAADTLDLSFTILAGNVAPSWYAESDTLRINEGSVYTHIFPAPSDVNLGDVVTVTAGTLPAGASFNSTNRTFSWTPGYNDAGVYQFVLTAADQDQARSSIKITVIVTDVNRPPVLTTARDSLTVNEGDPVSFSAIATDPDRNLITYSVTVTPQVEGWVFLNGEFSWRQTVVGNYLVNVVAIDEGGLSAQAHVSIRVSAVNRPPEFVPVEDVAVDAGAQVRITLTATDPDNDPLTYSVVLASQTSNILTRGGSLAGNVFTWTPAAADIGPNLVAFKVQDPDSASDLVTAKITVTGRNIKAPVAFADFPVQEVMEGVALVYKLPLSDSTSWSRDSLSFWARDLPQGSAFNALTGSVTWTPGLLQAGNYMLTCGVNDGKFQDIRKLKVRVLEKDVPPVLSPIGNLRIKEDSLLSLSLSAADSSGEQISFSAAGLPAGAKIFTRGLLQYKPGFEASSDYPVTVTVTDASGNTDSENLTITVLDVNRKPKLDVSDKVVDEGHALSFTVTAADPDNDPLTLGSGTLPAGAAFTAASGAFSWTPGATQGGNYTVLFTASDGKTGGVDSARVIISVGNVNRPPKIDPLADVNTLEGQPLAINITASDPDPDNSLTITVTGLPGGASVSQSGANPRTASISFTPGYRTQGNYLIKVSATDNDATNPLTVDSKFHLVIGDVDVAPSFTGSLTGSSPAVLSVNENGRLEVNLTVEDQGGDRVVVNAAILPTNSRIERKSGSTPDQWIFTPTYTQAGAVQFDLVASDGGQTATKTVQVTVSDVNRPPSLPAIADQAVYKGDIISFAVDANDPDGDALSVHTAGRVSFLTEGTPPPATIRDGNVFVFDTDRLPDSLQIRSAVFLFWAADVKGAMSDTVQVEIAVVRRDSAAVNLSSGVTLAASSTISTPGFGVSGTISNNTGGPLAGNFDYSEKSGFIETPSGLGLLASAGEAPAKRKGVYTFRYLAGDLTSQFYGIRRGWGLDLTAFAPATGADSLPTGLNAVFVFKYFDEDLPTEVPNFTEDRIKVFGFDAEHSSWVLVDSQMVDTLKNEASFKMTNPQMVDYTLGAVVDVVAPVISGLEVTGGSNKVASSGVDTLYYLAGTFNFKVNVTDDEVLSSTDVSLFYAVGGEAFRTAPLVRSGPNLFTAKIEEGTLASGTVLSYYVQARDNMNVVNSPAGAPGLVYQLVLLEYTGRPGDVDGNTNINIFDLLALLKVIGGKAQPSAFTDVNIDGKTDIFDLLALLKLLKK